MESDQRSEWNHGNAVYGIKPQGRYARLCRDDIQPRWGILPRFELCSYAVQGQSPWCCALRTPWVCHCGAIFGSSLVRAQTRSLSIICAVARPASCDASRGKSLPLRQKAKRQSPKWATVFLAEKERFELSRRYNRPTPLAGAPLHHLSTSPYKSVNFGLATIL